jgi:CheY-like chemotaxis protein
MDGHVRPWLHIGCRQDITHSSDGSKSSAATIHVYDRGTPAHGGHREQEERSDALAPDMRDLMRLHNVEEPRHAQDLMHERGGEIRVTLGVEDRFAWSRVTDTDSGMPDDVQVRASEPGVTTMKVAEGTTVRRLLPTAATAVRQRPTAERAHRTVAPNGAAVLLIEDDDALRGLAARVLRGAGYHVTEAIDGESGADRLRGAAELSVPFAVIVSDIEMPRGGGVRVQEARQRYATETPLLWVTGNPGAVGDDGRSQVPSVDPLLQKPWTAADLLRHVHGATARSAMAQTASSATFTV